MKDKNIHPDFQTLPAFELPFNRPFRQLVMNGGLDLAAAMKFSKFRKIVDRKQILGPDGHQVRIWVIRPENLAKPSAALLYFHGGAFVLKHSPQHIENTIRYAHEANCSVIFVDYRLSPKHAFPTGFNDCYGALTWTIQNAGSLGIDTQRVAVGGDSAGGAFAATVAQKAAHDDSIKLCGQLLIYPVIDSECKSASSAAFSEVPPFKRFSVKAMWNAYLGKAADSGVLPYASPLHGNLSGLAPAYVETGEFDPLRDEGAAYAQALVTNGVNVTFNDTKGTVHGYDLVAAHSALAQQAIQNRVQFLRRIFHT